MAMTHDDAITEAKKRWPYNSRTGLEGYAWFSFGDTATVGIRKISNIGDIVLMKSFGYGKTFEEAFQRADQNPEAKR